MPTASSTVDFIFCSFNYSIHSSCCCKSKQSLSPRQRDHEALLVERKWIPSSKEEGGDGLDMSWEKISKTSLRQSFSRENGAEGGPG